MKDKIRILLADDHLVVRMGLAAIIGIEPDMSVVGEACDGEEAVTLAARLTPDVVIMDLMMPRQSGAEATAAIVKANPDAKVLVLTSFAGSNDLRNALDAGAIGAIVKDAVHAELIQAIRATASGTRQLSPVIERQLKSAPPTPELTSRHLEILRLVAKGLNNREIGKVIGIGPDCVKAHLRTAFARLGAASRSEAVACAVANGLISI